MGLIQAPSVVAGGLRTGLPSCLVSIECLSYFCLVNMQFNLNLTDIHLMCCYGHLSMFGDRVNGHVSAEYDVHRCGVATR